MNKNLMLARIAAIVSTLAEVEGTPESNLYMLCEMNMADYELIRDILLRAGFVMIKNHYVTLTSADKETAQELNKRIN